MAKSPKLKFYGVIRSESYIAQDDCIFILKHHTVSDRMYKLYYDQIDSIVLWRRFPIVRMILLFLIFGVPGLFMVFSGDETALIVGAVLLLITSIFLARYLYCGQTIIRITRNDTTRELKTIVRPGRINQFLNFAIERINTIQDKAREEAGLLIEEAPIDASLIEDSSVMDESMGDSIDAETAFSPIGPLDDQGPIPLESASPNEEVFPATDSADPGDPGDPEDPGYPEDPD